MTRSIDLETLRSENTFNNLRKDIRSLTIKRTREEAERIEKLVEILRRQNVLVSYPSFEVED